MRTPALDDIHVTALACFAMTKGGTAPALTSTSHINRRIEPCYHTRPGALSSTCQPILKHGNKIYIVVLLVE